MALVDISRIHAMGGSFRDPQGVLYSYCGRTIRAVSAQGAKDLTAFLSTRAASVFTRSGRLVTSRILEADEADKFLAGIDPSHCGFLPHLILEHETIPFKSYPYEWPFEMLKEAAHLTLDLAEATLTEGMGLKDATPYNVLFRGPTAVFVDVLSFERRTTGDPIWLACGQFERTFLIPLLLSSELDLSPGMLLLPRRDGLYPREAYPAFRGRRKFKTAVFSSVTLPSLLENNLLIRNLESRAKQKTTTGEKADFILASLFRRLRRAIARIPAPGGKASRWMHYMADRESYREDQFAQKQKLVEAAIDEFKPRHLLDIGCNTGHFSKVAAQKGAAVIAIDSDSRVIGKLWQEASAGKLDILPLVVSISQPSPSIGWCNAETSSFLERAKGKFDAVLLLAVIHHLLVTERIPLAAILDLIADLTSNIAIVEFVSSKDPMFQKMASVNQDLYHGVSNDAFEQACHRRFTILRSMRLPLSERWLHVLRKKSG